QSVIPEPARLETPRQLFETNVDVAQRAFVDAVEDPPGLVVLLARALLAHPGLLDGTHLAAADIGREEHALVRRRWLSFEARLAVVEEGEEGIFAGSQ